MRELFDAVPKNGAVRDVQDLRRYRQKSHVVIAVRKIAAPFFHYREGHSLMNDGARKQDGNEAREKPGHELSLSVPNTMSAFQHSGPGILVFSHRRPLGHVNRRALELTGHLDQAKNGPTTGTLSRLVSDLRVQIQDTLDNRRNVDIWELFELRRDMGESGRKILLRGFGVPDRNSQNDSRIVFVLEEVDHRREHQA